MKWRLIPGGSPLSSSIPATVPVPGFPGQSSNPVGFAFTPAQAPARWDSFAVWPGAFPGSLTPASTVTFASGTPTAPTVIAFQDFQAGTTPGLGTTNTTLSLPNHDIIFVGCRFGFNTFASTGPGSNTNILSLTSAAYNVQFFYCTFAPLTSLYTSPPGEAWPSAGALLNTTTQVDNVNCVVGTEGYQFGIGAYSTSNSGLFMLNCDHCDFWGFGNGGIDTITTKNPILVYDCWVHDACNASPLGYHIDGLGYFDELAAPSNYTIEHCTIVSLGDSVGAIGFQGTTTTYVNINVLNCYLGGFNITVDMCNETAGSTPLTFTGNQIGQDVQSVFGPIYGDPTSLFTLANGNLWRNNIFIVPSGCVPAPTSGFTFTAANNGQFIWPDGTLSNTDYSG